MLLSTREIDVMRLLRWCRYISVCDLKKVFSEEELFTLTSLRFITLYQRSCAYVLTSRGSAFLEEHGNELPPPTRPSYRDSDTLRRLRAARVVLTAYRAGFSVFTRAQEVLQDSPSFWLTSLARTRGTNPWGSSRTVALLRLGDTIYGVHYVCPGIGKISLNDELQALSNNTSRFPNVKLGLIFAGESCADILSELTRTEGKTDSRLVSYGEAFRESPLPVCLLPCSDAGAKQLLLMAKPDYRRHYARAALGSLYCPPPEELPELDAMFRGAPLVIAVDLDLRRVDAALEKSKEKGLEKPVIVSTIEQAGELLRERYANRARVLTLKDAILGENGPLTLYTPPDTPYLTPKGDPVHAPLIQTDRKAGRPR